MNGRAMAARSALANIARKINRGVHQEIGRSASARRPASVIRSRVTSTGVPAAKVRSGVAVANLSRTKRDIMSKAKPCATKSASVVPSALAASISNRRRSSSVMWGDASVKDHLLCFRRLRPQRVLGFLRIE
jgi:hypothetical protein